MFTSIPPQMFLLQSDLIIIPTVPIRRITKGLGICVILANNELHFYIIELENHF